MLLTSTAGITGTSPTISIRFVEVYARCSSPYVDRTIQFISSFYLSIITHSSPVSHSHCPFHIAQPSVTPAYSNTLYVPKVMSSLEKNTPTSLIQTYYSCVLAPWPAFLQAVGIGTASAAFFVFGGFSCYMFLLVQFLNACLAARIPSTSKMVSDGEGGYVVSKPSFSTL